MQKMPENAVASLLRPYTDNCQCWDCIAGSGSIGCVIYNVNPEWSDINHTILKLIKKNWGLEMFKDDTYLYEIAKMDIFNDVIEKVIKLRGNNIPEGLIFVALGNNNIKLLELLKNKLNISFKTLHLEVGCRLSNDKTIYYLLNEKIVPTERCFINCIYNDVVTHSRLRHNECKFSPKLGVYNGWVDFYNITNLDLLLQYGYIITQKNFVMLLSRNIYISDYEKYNFKLTDRQKDLCKNELLFIYDMDNFDIDDYFRVLCMDIPIGDLRKISDFFKVKKFNNNEIKERLLSMRTDNAKKFLCIADYFDIALTIDDIKKYIKNIKIFNFKFWSVIAEKKKIKPDLDFLKIVCKYSQPRRGEIEKLLDYSNLETDLELIGMLYSNNFLDETTTKLMDNLSEESKNIFLLKKNNIYDKIDDESGNESGNKFENDSESDFALCKKYTCRIGRVNNSKYRDYLFDYGTRNIYLQTVQKEF